VQLAGAGCGQQGRRRSGECIDLDVDAVAEQAVTKTHGRLDDAAVDEADPDANRALGCKGSGVDGADAGVEANAVDGVADAARDVDVKVFEVPERERAAEVAPLQPRTDRRTGVPAPASC